MGKLTLLFVLAAALGGALLTFNTRQLMGGTEQDRRGVQAEVLARDLAQSVHAVVSGAMMGTDGFKTLTNLGIPTALSSGGARVGTVEYAGGMADVTYELASDRQTVDFAVTAFQEGAIHRVRASYAYDDVDFPTPLWLDVPYVTTSLAPGTTITGGADNRQALFDRSKYDALGLAGFAPPLATMAAGVTSGLLAAVGGTDRLMVENQTQLARWPGMEDINVTTAEGLYFAAIDAMGAGDTDLGTTSVIANSRTYGSATNPVIVRAPNGLAISAGGRIRGTGALVVEGPLTVAVGGTLDWDGLVIVHSELNYLPVRLQGTVTIDGALVVDQQGAPPGGHMDVSTWQAPTGTWASPAGDLTGSPFCATLIAQGYRCPLYQHTHRFDLTPVANPRGQTIRFLGRDVVETQLQAMLNRLGTTQVYLEFVNNQTYSGMGRYSMDVNGAVENGVVRLGFAQADDTRGVRSQRFASNQLRDFTLEVRSLRMLRPLFDGSRGCDVSWPICVGENRNRQQALTVRLRNASNNQVYYEASVYWHMQQAEAAQHEAEEAEWRRRIADGEAFGTRLETSATTRLRFDVEMIRLIGPRLGFDPPERHLLSTTTEHWEVGQPGGPAMTVLPSSGNVLICHDGKTMLMNVSAARPHVSHGDRIGACPAGGAGGTPPADPNAIVAICCRGTTHRGTLAQLLSHINGHGAVMGACSGGSDDDDDD